MRGGVVGSRRGQGQWEEVRGRSELRREEEEMTIEGERRRLVNEVRE